MTPEQWKDITGLEGVYQVSDQGRVRLLDRITNIGHKRKGAMIKTPPNNSGYPEVLLWKGGKLACAVLVHCLVLEAIVGQCPEGEENDRPQMPPSGVGGEILRGMNG